GADLTTWDTIAKQLGAGYRIVVRQHPFVRQHPGSLPTTLIDGSGGDMNSLLMATDILVTDYSSSIFEYALLRRPYILFAPDLHDYDGARSFYRPYEDYAVAPIVT